PEQHADDKQQAANDHNAAGYYLFFGIKAGLYKTPDLIENVRERRYKTSNESLLNVYDKGSGEYHGLNGKFRWVETQCTTKSKPVGQIAEESIGYKIRMGRPQNNGIEKPVLEKEKYNPYQEYSDQRPDDMPAQFLEMIQEGHFLFF